MLENFNNYGPYAELIKTGKITIKTEDITIDTWDSYFNGILNVFRDGIETDLVQSVFITVDFGNDIQVELTTFDYFFNILMWYLLIRTKQHIQPKHIFFDMAITKSSIKNFIDDFFIEINRKLFTNKELNNIIDDVLYHYNVIDQFSLYLANTINLEDDIALMKASADYFNILHADLSNVPIEDVKDVGMEYTERAITHMTNAKSILGYDHCLADSWRSEEGLNKKQYKEYAINIGSKPDGQGGVFPTIINKSFLTGGVNDIVSNMIESHTGRTAQILAKMNVGSSGHFARLLGLNNFDTFLHEDPDYICNTKSFEIIEIKNKTTLRMYNNRYYRLHEDGMEYIINSKKDTHLIGKTIYLRSPMTCASNARGEGICYRCYGDLAYTTRDINIGRIASETVSSKLTQILLSAKHLLETVVKRLRWVAEFFTFFEIEGNVIKLIPDTNFKGYNLIIDPDDINIENEDDEYVDFDEDDDRSQGMYYNENISQFTIVFNDKEILVKTEDEDKLYLSNELNSIIRRKAAAAEGKVSIHLNDLQDIPIFLMVIHNNELSDTLNKLKNLLNKKEITESLDRNQLLQEVIDTVIKGDLRISGIHLEVILSNQIRDIDYILDNPRWEYPNEPCRIVTLDRALKDNPSVTITLSYQRLSKALYNPLTFKKRGVSFMDLFFMEQPQLYLQNDNIIPGVKESDVENNMYTAVFFDKPIKDVDEDLLDIED